METGDKGPKPPSEHKERGSEAIRRKMILVKRAAFNFAHDSSPDRRPKQYLPDNPIIPLGNGMDLIAVETLRADDLYVPRTPDDNPDGKEKYSSGSDSIRIPSSFIQSDSYAVLLVPRVAEENYIKGAKLVNQGMYDITVVKRKDGKTALKLMDMDESLKTDTRIIFDDSNGPFDFPLTTIPIGEDGAVIWTSSRIRIWHLGYNAKQVYEKTVNGTVCYRMIEGKAEKKKSREPRKSLVLNPANSSI